MTQHQPDYLSHVAGHTPELFMNIARLLPKDDIIRLSSTNRMFKNFGKPGEPFSMRNNILRDRVRDSFAKEYEEGRVPIRADWEQDRANLRNSLGEAFVFPEGHDQFAAEHQPDWDDPD